jgi:hypothetical protein
MQRRHRARLDTSAAGREPAPLHELVALPKLGHEAWDFAEVVAGVGVAHDHVPSAGGRDASHQCVAIPALGDVHDASTVGARDVRRAIRAAVVSDDHFAGDAVLAQRRLCGVDALRQSLRLVEAGHDDRQLDLRRWACGVGLRGPVDADAGRRRAGWSNGHEVGRIRGATQRSRRADRLSPPTTDESARRSATPGCCGTDQVVTGL